MSAQRDITVMVVGPMHKADVQVVKADYRVFNQLVGGPAGPGSISMLRLPQELRSRGYAAYCDDDAVARGQEPNAYAEHFGHWRLLGPVVFFSDEGTGDETSLGVDEVRWLASYLAHGPSEEARAQAAYDRYFWKAHPSGMAFKSFNTLDELFEDIGL